MTNPALALSLPNDWAYMLIWSQGLLLSGFSYWLSSRYFDHRQHPEPV